MADLLKLKKVVDAAVKFAKTPFEMAHELAQKRAALPVAMRGLGLPAGNTAEQRAKALGFLGEGYHGSMSDIKKFSANKASTESHAGRGTYITDSPKDASLNYANIYGPDVMGKVENGLLQLGDDRNPIDRIAKGLSRQTLTPRQQEVLLSNTTGADNLGVVYPLRYRSDMPVHLDRPQAKEVRVGPFEHYDEVNDEYIESPLAGKLNDALDEYREAGGDPSRIIENLLDYSGESIPADKLYRDIVKAAERSDLYDPDTGDAVSGGVAAGDFLRHFGVDEIAHTPDFRNQQLNIGTKHTVSMNPENIRSRFAAFDPWRINAATAAAMGVAAPDLLAKEPKKKAVGGPVHMQVGGISKIPSLVRAVGQAASKSKPFYSAVDEAIAKITQGKGTSDQFLAMIRNTPGVKPAEIADRKLGALLTGKGKMTKEQLQEIAAKNPAPQIVEREIGDKSFNARVEEITDELVQDKIDGYESMGESPKNAAWLADSERDDLFRQAHAKVMDEGGYDPQYQRYSTPGGENYREILIKLPNKNLSTKDIAFDLYGKAMAFLTEGEKNAVHAEMRKQFDARPEFKTTHYGGDENILAHARVQDRTGPNGEKILHIEEIQSDWHQKGRKSGYGQGKYVYKVEDVDGRIIGTFDNQKEAEDLASQRRYSKLHSVLVERGVPDAPFKKNWHELVLKRLVDDAARNGYDRVVITPGAEQAKRYGISSQIDEIKHQRNEDGTYKVTAYKGDNNVWSDYAATPKVLEDTLGADVAKKITDGSKTPYSTEKARAKVLAAVDRYEAYMREPSSGHTGEEAIRYAQEAREDPSSFREMLEPYGITRRDIDRYYEGPSPHQYLSGLDLQVGGEGMKGFYDEIIPSAVNKLYGKHGVKFGTQNIEGAEGVVPYHSFDITPQLRESIIKNGQSLYMAAPLGVAVDSALEQEEPVQQRKGGAVNQDAMNMAVWNKQLRKQHG
jgi:hypothetical protein